MNFLLTPPICWSDRCLLATALPSLLWYIRINIFMLQSSRQKVLIDQSPVHLLSMKAICNLLRNISLLTSTKNEGICYSDVSSMSPCLSLNFAETHICLTSRNLPNIRSTIILVPLKINTCTGACKMRSLGKTRKKCRMNEKVSIKEF